MVKTLIIGDIHGCDHELQALLDKAGLVDGDRVIGIGDMVDRGPETPQVAEFFQKSPGVRAVMGNHERKHARAARHEVKLSISQQISKAQFGTAYPGALVWMDGLPLYIELEDAILAHGYIEPGIALDQQSPAVLCGTMTGDKILRERYARPWYELYEGGKPVIVGHYNYTKTDQPFIFQDKVIGLDTDCVTGRSLTGILLPAFQFVAVPSRGNLWMQVRRAFETPKPKPALPQTGVVWSAAQDEQLRVLVEKLLEVNESLLTRLRELPGFADLTPRQQTKLYSERIGQGVITNLLHLTRHGELDFALVKKVVFAPERLDALIEKATELGNTCLFEDRDLQSKSLTDGSIELGDIKS